MTARKDAPSAAVRIRAMKRDRFQCTYCGTPGTDAELEIDHIVAVANGGSHHISNLTTACRKCNQRKGSGPAPARVKTMRHPAADHPLVGMCMHTLKDGEVCWQGHILGVDGDVVLVQLYSWMDGGPTSVEVMNKSEIYSERCRLYSTHEDMNIAYEKIAYARREKGLRGLRMSA